MEALGVVEKKQVEIEHVGDFDIIVNWKQTSITEYELGRLRDELISNSKKLAGNNPLEGWVGFGYPSRFLGTERRFADRKNDPRYFAKQKWLDKDDDSLKEAIKKRRGINGDSDYTKISYYAGASLLNEMSLASRIKEITTSTEAQSIADSVGAQSIDFIEPLVGLINRRTGKKTMIYRFTRGDACTKFDDRFIPREVAHKMEALYLKNGIVPDDFQASQMLQESGPNGEIIYHIIDSEFFFKDQATASTS